MLGECSVFLRAVSAHVIELEVIPLSVKLVYMYIRLYDLPAMVAFLYTGMLGVVTSL